MLPLPFGYTHGRLGAARRPCDNDRKNGKSFCVQLPDSADRYYRMPSGHRLGTPRQLGPCAAIALNCVFAAGQRSIGRLRGVITGSTLRTGCSGTRRILVQTANPSPPADCPQLLGDREGQDRARPPVSLPNFRQGLSPLVLDPDVNEPKLGVILKVL